MLPCGLKEIPLILLLGDQVRLPCEFEVSITVTVQDQILPVLSGVQGLPLKSDKPVGLTVNVGGGWVIVTVTDCGDWPADSVPFGGLKVVPGKSLSALTDQSILP